MEEVKKLGPRPA